MIKAAHAAQVSFDERGAGVSRDCAVQDDFSSLPEVLDLVSRLQHIAVSEAALACLMPGLFLGSERPADAMSVCEERPHARMNAQVAYRFLAYARFARRRYSA